MSQKNETLSLFFSRCHHYWFNLWWSMVSYGTVGAIKRNWQQVGGPNTRNLFVIVKQNGQTDQ